MKTKSRPPKRHFTKTHAKVYWPYLPFVILLIGSLFMNGVFHLQRQSTATLAYATEMSRSALLSSTNAQRASNGAGNLTLNDKLNAAAQAKANDMVTRDYWSHNTPDGQEPWVFIDAQGYVYSKAGENLAYGFNTSPDTIVGWMNSPSHRANMLDSLFSEVGFGFANSANFVGTGEETIVVAMYGKPIVAAVPAPAPTPAPTPASAPQSVQSQTNAKPTPAPVPAPEPDVAQAPPADVAPIEVVVPETDATKDAAPITTDAPVPQVVASERITLLQQFTQGAAPWSAVAVSSIGLLLAGAWLVKHFIAVRRFIIDGEHFVAHHPVLDLVVVSIVAAAVYLSQSAGVIL